MSSGTYGCARSDIQSAGVSEKTCEQEHADHGESESELSRDRKHQADRGADAGARRADRVWPVRQLPDHGADEGPEQYAGEPEEDADDAPDAGAGDGATR